MKEMIFIIGMLGLAMILGLMENRRIEKVNKMRKQRELQRKIKLQNKIDEFEVFKSKIEAFDKCEDGCLDCREFNYLKYEQCKQARKYFQKRGGAINNIRITLQDYTIQDVLTLYGEKAI